MVNNAGNRSCRSFCSIFETTYFTPFSPARTMSTSSSFVGSNLVPAYSASSDQNAFSGISGTFGGLGGLTLGRRILVRLDSSAFLKPLEPVFFL